MLRITDRKGRQVLGLDEPNPDSVLLLHGEHGTAAQRLSNGSWRTVTGATTSWDAIKTQRNVFLVYSAPPRAAR